jgi:hypothetical protein
LGEFKEEDRCEEEDTCEEEDAYEEEHMCSSTDL